MLLRLTLSLFAGLLLATGCSPVEEVDGDPAPRPVNLLTVADDSSSQIRRFPAVVEATQTAELAFRVGGEVDTLPFRPGQSVDAGELVAALDAQDYELAVEQASARAELLDAQHRRNQRMKQQDLISPAEFDQSQADLRIAEAELNRAQTNLEYTRLKAPFAGVVASLHVEKHENVSPQQPILTLQVDNLIDVSIQVPERLFARVRRDLDYQPDVLFDGLPGQFFKASIREWDRVADPATNTYRVVFSLPAPANVNILPGMTATVLIDAHLMTQDIQSSLLVPASAVFAPDDKPLQPGIAYVWLYHSDNDDDGHVKLHPIRIGDMTNDGLQVIEGLQPGDRVVHAGVHHLSDGQRVKPWVRERGL
ncbi:efflux RND transporter periplasmic adaptor subunit [Aliidiomarina minuta]|nr:efflux RND transporter periplasmic adaptor subunit [Aliidiomarina minuta]